MNAEMTLDEAWRSDVARGEWPSAVSDGLSIPCVDCGAIPRFDYRVSDGFWQRWAPGVRGVVCLPCLDARSGGEGLADALEEVQWTGTGHTVVFRRNLVIQHGREASAPATGAVAAEQPERDGSAVGSTPLGHTFTAPDGSVHCRCGLGAVERLALAAARLQEQPR